ncbi:MAG: hypothetical protein LBI78_02050 [Campylobacteraceae bacterium]|jgi:hypothetical protein|nr:hypothetical protein [Campylobacteraceae bacterium]
MLIFWASAIFGSIFFVLRTAASIVGGFGNDDIDDTSDNAFKLISLNSITSFIAMFGWAGLAAYSQYEFSFFTSLVIAVFCGIITMFLTAFLFKQAMKLVGVDSAQNDMISESLSQRMDRAGFRM